MAALVVMVNADACFNNVIASKLQYNIDILLLALLLGKDPFSVLIVW